MDKEARQRIGNILQQKFGRICTSSDGVWAGYQLDHKTSDDFTRQVILAMEELGYRKLPKDKPPLLSDDKIKDIIDDLTKRDLQDSTLIAIQQGAKAQRESDIKWYEGK